MINLKFNNHVLYFKQDTEKMYTSNITYLPYLIYNDVRGQKSYYSRGVIPSHVNNELISQMRTDLRDMLKENYGYATGGNVIKYTIYGVTRQRIFLEKLKSYIVMQTLSQ